MPDIEPLVARETVLVGPGTDPYRWFGTKPALDRDDSTKPTTNPKSHNHHHQQQQQQDDHYSASKRFSGNLKATAKAPIIALPNRIDQHHSGYLGRSARKRLQCRGKIFPRKGVKLSDPGSPKVSCLGKVLPGREKRRSRCCRCWTGAMAAVFSCFGGGRREESAAVAVESDGRITARKTKVEASSAAAEVVPGLGGMRRFVSGRRPASWGGDVDADLDLDAVGHVAWSGPLDRSW